MITIQNIRELLWAAGGDERLLLGCLLDVPIYSPTGIRRTVDEEGRLLTKELYWKYQTPLGYFAVDPSFDDICKDVAKRLKLGGLAKGVASCWQLLGRIRDSLWDSMISNMPAEEKEELARTLFQEKEFKDVAGTSGWDWAKVGAASSLLALKQFGGFATYKIALIVTNQAAKALVGRGLALAANAALTRSVSLALGPVGWLLLAWGINDLFGTNYKKLIPAVLYIYCIYLRLNNSNELPPTLRLS